MRLILGGKFKPPPSFGGHFLSGRARRSRSRSMVEWKHSRVKMEVRGVWYHLGGDVEPKKLSVKFTFISESW